MSAARVIPFPAPAHCQERQRLTDLYLGLVAKICEAAAGAADLKSEAWRTATKETREACEGALADLRDRPEWCLDLSFMGALLHTGYEMPMDREVKIAKQIQGRELGWCLGASLPLLEKESGWQCRVKEAP